MPLQLLQGPMVEQLMLILHIYSSWTVAPLQSLKFDDFEASYNKSCQADDDDLNNETSQRTAKKHFRGSAHRSKTLESPSPMTGNSRGGGMMVCRDVDWSDTEKTKVVLSGSTVAPKHWDWVNIQNWAAGIKDGAEE